MPTATDETQRMASALDFLERYHEDVNKFLSHIVRVTGDETCVSFVNVETKEQSKQFKQTSARKLMAVVLWDRTGVLVVELKQQRTTITSEIAKH
jgi:hypothetical protein